MYEEELNGSPNPPYTSYYSFGGKLVGMRLANQPDPATNGQLRVAGDHLGSATLVIDTSSPPQVIHRQFYKPYGEVALSSGSSRTSVGYTGQRLDSDSGLMFYGARFYDPVLSYFVSSDTIAPDPTNPKTRDRYSYVLNNPVLYNDPTGHCEAHNAAERQRCREAASQLAELGLEHDENCKASGPGDAYGDCRPFTPDDLELVLEAIGKLMSTAGWDIAAFRNAMGMERGSIKLQNRDLQKLKPGSEVWGGASRYEGKGGGILALDLKVLHNWKDAESDVRIKSTIVHELAHIWDETGPKMGNGSLRDYNRYQHAHEAAACQCGGPASQYGKDDEYGGEDFAESVAAMVYGDEFASRYKNYNPDFKNGARASFVRRLFAAYR